MNRKRKIIVSITGITVVMLALLGLTYGYYLTNIYGNTNNNSISVTTADLTLKYDDGTSYINLTNIMPGVVTDGEGDNLLPKVFTVTNDGTSNVEYSIGMDEVTNTLTRTQDLTYSITCHEKLIDSADTSYTSCARTSSNSGEYPKINSYLFTNQIKKGYIQKYKVVVSYANPDEDQSVDMGSTIKGRMQIYSVPESIDITGTVTGATSGDYVQINSNPKTSIISKDGTYKLIGIEPGTHTLKVMNGSITKGTKEIVVKQGTNAGISGNKITFTENERVATINITSISTNLGLDITEIKEHTVGLLKDVIIANAKKAASENSTTRTIYSETPLTTPLVETSAFIFVDGKVSQTELTYNSYTGSTTLYYTYGDTYEFNESTGKYTIKNSDSSSLSTVQGFSTLTGKYVVTYYGSRTETPESATEKSMIYYIIGVDDQNIYYIRLSGGKKSNEYYYTYGDTYDFNEQTGTYTIKNRDGSPLQSVKYNTNYETLKNKYIVSTSGTASTLAVSGENENTIYKVSSNSTSEVLKYYTITRLSQTKSTENVLSITQDNYGPTYYFRGGVQDNYVLFNNICWRVVRINGDGSIKLTLAGEVEEGAIDCTGVSDSSSIIQNNVTYGYKKITGIDGFLWDIADYENDGKTSTNTIGNSEISLKESLDTWFDSKFKSDGKLTKAGQKIKEETWCLGGDYNYKYNKNTGVLLNDSGLNAVYKDYHYYRWDYSSGKRLFTTKIPDLTCGTDEEKNISRIGALTSDEVILAGASLNSTTNTSYYLYDNAKFTYYWTLSRESFESEVDNIFCVYYAGFLTSYVYTSEVDSRPAVSLVNGIEINSGDGTINNPYVIN